MGRSKGRRQQSLLRDARATRQRGHRYRIDLYERAGGVTNLISTGPNGGNGAADAFFDGASSDGTKVFFHTTEALVAGDTDGTNDVYQRSAGTTTIISQGPTGGNGSSDAFYVGCNQDGSRVWFVSYEELTSADNDHSHKDVYERSGGTTTLLSTSSSLPNGNFGADFAGASQDGARVFFFTDESMVAADTDSNTRDIYERVGGTTNLVSIGPAPGAGTAAQRAFWGGASSDGTHVFFTSTEKLTTDDTDSTCIDDFGATVQCSDVYERFNGTTTLVSTSASSPNGPYRAAFGGNSSDGLRVFFQTDEPLDPADTDGPPSNGCQDVNGNPTLHCIDVYERSGGTTTLVSTSPTPPNSASTAVFRAVSQDGARVFFSTDERLVAADTDSVADIYERSGGNTTLVSTGPAGGNGGFDATFDGISADGTRVFFDSFEALTSNDTDPNWSDVYERYGSQTYLLSTGPTGGGGTNSAFFAGSSTDGTRVYFQTDEALLGSDTDVEQDIYVTTVPSAYARPKGAGPVRLPLVPAYQECALPGNRTHASPWNFPSCNPATQESGQLTVGTVDANGQQPKFNAYVRYRVIPGNPGTPADEADVGLELSAPDVRNRADLSDYAGQLQTNATLRITDRSNGAANSETGTVSDITLSFIAPCTTTPADATVGSTCGVNTTADAVLGAGAVVEIKRAIWQLGQVEVFDGGPDGLASTSPNTLFAVQGIFVP